MGIGWDNNILKNSIFRMGLIRYNSKVDACFYFFEKKSKKGVRYLVLGIREGNAFGEANLLLANAKVGSF